MLLVPPMCGWLIDGSVAILKLSPASRARGVRDFGLGGFGKSSQKVPISKGGGRWGWDYRPSRLVLLVYGPVKVRPNRGLVVPVYPYPVDPPLFLSALPECHRRTVVAISSRGVLSLRLEPSPILNELGGLPRRA